MFFSSLGPTARPRRRATQALAVVAVVGAMVGVSFSTSGAAEAATPQTVFVTTPFTGPTSPGYIEPSAPSGSNVACLTAGTDTSAGVPGCSATAIDPTGSGALRLTSNANSLEGGVGSTQSVPISKGLDAVFDSYQYGGNRADGIAFYLAATDPYNPQVPTVIGQAGGSLGYSPTGASAGLAHGYLGLGLDEYGNYLSSGFDGSGCSTAPGSGTQATNVSVRGPGNGSVGYCVLPGYNASIGGKNALESTSRAASRVPVEVIVNPASTIAASAGTSDLTSISVPAMSYAIVFKTIGATSQKVVTGTLPDLRTPAYSGLFPSAWYDPTTGLPYKLTFGWVASTGGNTDVHEVNNFSAQTLNGPVPELTADSTVDDSAPGMGSSDTYTVTPAVSGQGGSETQPVRVTTTFPSRTTPAPSISTDYTCTISGQTETCTYTGTTAAGASLPALALPFTATGPVSSTAQSITSQVSSADATTVTTSSSITVVKHTTTTTVSAPQSVDYATSETITATVTPSSATGTVDFVDSTTGATLCAAAPVSSGRATCPATNTGPLGAHTITATYSGDAAGTGSTGTATTTVQKAASTITASASPAETSFGTTSTLTATGIPSGATGTVRFTDASNTVLCATTADAPHCTTAADLAAGTYAVTAKYDGDADFAESSSASTPLTIDKATANIAAAVDAATGTVYGTPATLSVTGLASGSTGTVTFSDTNTGVTLCTATLPATSCATSGTLDAGTYAVNADYPGDAERAAATSNNPTVLTITTAPTPTITAQVDHSSVEYGAAGTFTTTGIPSGDAGTVRYTTADGAVLCTATLPTTSCGTATTLPAGSYDVTATYSGDTDHSGATAAAIPFTVTPATATVQASVDDGPNATVVYATAATLDSTGLAPSATGTVAYQAGGTALCTATLPTTTCDTSGTVEPGAYSITAVYSGDHDHQAETSPAVSLTVAKATAALTDTVNGGPSAATSYGTAATLDSAGYPTGATGTVEYLDQNGDLVCTATLPTTSCTTDPQLAAGDHTVTATYTGDAHNEPVTTTTGVTLHITRGGVTTLASTVNGLPTATVVHGHTARLNSTGVPSSATGTVAYETADGTVICRTTLPNTTCDTPAGLAGGTDAITAHYSGDGNHDAAVGPVVMLRIAAEPTTMTEHSTVATHGTGHTTTLAVAGVAAGATGTVAFTTNGKALCTVTLPDRSCTTTVLAAGRHTITARYSGDASYAESTATGTVTIAAALAPHGAHRVPGALGKLAYTGFSNGGGLLGSAALLLSAGAVLLIARRRRRLHGDAE
ncbi:Ig-like domain repeat protein [Curtobacterium sp. ISL-83]|uniref:Ig-like domain repeat protein n=1 Tax=Curtobacterium sp. ISL-83 TaxID=2819145 RepID=UPI001BE7AFBC|nr:Ig-like domain repeat protein [Curtobacterium sp. ISL-83]MBT2502211.1 Ig-like domain repeat protein [Curtobacterium sp. ISL-83]